MWLLPLHLTPSFLRAFPIRKILLYLKQTAFFVIKFFWFENLLSQTVFGIELKLFCSKNWPLAPVLYVSPNQI